MTNQDFFLNPDEAQTLGNIKYMRKSVRVRHTFPKTVKNSQGFEVVKEISSLEDNSSNPVPERSQESSSSSSTIPSISSSSPKSTQTSSNMDMFRNMARKIGKR